jgi:hypothetical protein
MPSKPGESRADYQRRRAAGAQGRFGPAAAARAGAAAKKPSGCTGCLAAFGVLVVLAASITAGFLFFGNHASAAYRARVGGHIVINPATLDVIVRVTNTGSAAGTPDCTVTARNPAFSNSGVTAGTLTGKVQPGATATFVMRVTITNQGAASVTQVNADCK